MLSPQWVRVTFRTRSASSGGAQPGPHQANAEGASGYQAGSRSTATGNLPEAQGVSQYPQQPQCNYVVDGAIDTHHPIGAQKGKNGSEKQKFLCAHCRRKRLVIDLEAGCAAEMTRFTRCMFCVVTERDERSRRQLQAALLEELDSLRRGIEQSLGAFKARIEESTPARSGEASHTRAGEAVTEDLRKEFSAGEGVPRARRNAVQGCSVHSSTSSKKDQNCGFSSGSCLV